MKTIWKFPLKVADTQVIDIPMPADILTIQMQGETPCLWALVNPDAEEKAIKAIAIFGTGHPLPDRAMTYIGTFQLHGGALVFHVFEVH